MTGVSRTGAGVRDGTVLTAHAPPQGYKFTCAPAAGAPAQPDLSEFEEQDGAVVIESKHNYGEEGLQGGRGQRWWPP